MFWLKRKDLSVDTMMELEEALDHSVFKEYSADKGDRYLQISSV